MKMRMMVMAIVLLLICAGCQRVQPPTSHLSEPGPTLAPTATPYTPIAPTQARAGRVCVQVVKRQRKLFVWKDGVLLHTFAIGLGFAPEGHKQREGDGKTPQGAYYVCMRNEHSRYHLSLGLSYPNEEDAAAALAQGAITQAECNAIQTAIRAGRRPPWNTPLGGEIMIHGHGAQRDWTAGCIAVEDADMDVLWSLCPLGTQVLIEP